MVIRRRKVRIQDEFSRHAEPTGNSNLLEILGISVKSDPVWSTDLSVPFQFSIAKHINCIDLAFAAACPCLCILLFLAIQPKHKQTIIKIVLNWKERSHPSLFDSKGVVTEPTSTYFRGLSISIEDLIRFLLKTPPFRIFVIAIGFQDSNRTLFIGSSTVSIR
jgi:hypothetical protein